MALTTTTKTERTEKATFYEKLSKYDASWAKRKAVEFKQSADRTLTEWELQGNILIDAKARLGHGNFEGWIETELTPNYKIGIDTAERMMNAAKMLKDRPKLGGYGYTLLAELSKPSTPPEIVKEAEERAETASPMTVREIQKKVKEVKPKPQFEKGQFVEFLNGAERAMGMIVSSHFLKGEKPGFEYKLQYLHGPSFKGKYLEHNLKLCPVQIRQNYYDDCSVKPTPGTQVVFCPVTTWGQAWKDGIFTVCSSLKDWVVISNDDHRFFAHWAELKPYEQPTEVEQEEEGIIDIQSTEINDKQPCENKIESVPHSELKVMFYKFVNRIPELDDHLLDLLLRCANDESTKRKQTENS